MVKRKYTKNTYRNNFKGVVINIFRLHSCPWIAAKYYHDKHCSKICCEATQLLTNCYSVKQLEGAPKTQLGTVRKYSHLNHPISIWSRTCYGNFQWLLNHGVALSQEFKYRFDKNHFCRGFIEWANSTYPQNLENYDTWPTEQPQCFKSYPECIVNGDPVLGYQNYYNVAKLSFTRKISSKNPDKKRIIKNIWTRREIPHFIDRSKYDSIKEGIL